MRKIAQKIVEMHVKFTRAQRIRTHRSYEIRRSEFTDPWFANHIAPKGRYIPAQGNTLGPRTEEF